MKKSTTKKEYELHNMEIINNNFPERMDLLIPCSCGKSFKAQDGHFSIQKHGITVKHNNLKSYKNYQWKCRKKDKLKRKKYDANNPNRNREYSLNARIHSSLQTHFSRFKNEPCIFKKGNKFHTSKIAKEAREFNLQIIKELLINQNYKCALTGDTITELTASIDRIDSNHGYTEGNVQLVTVEANFAKQKLSIDNFFNLCKKVYFTLQDKIEKFSFKYETS